MANNAYDPTAATVINYNTITAKHSYAPSTSIQDTTAISINNDTSLLDQSHISARGGAGLSTIAPSPNLMQYPTTARKPQINKVMPGGN